MICPKNTGGYDRVKHEGTFSVDCLEEEENPPTDLNYIKIE
jgi:hypothetical protein